jgi:hypothetical protein
MKKKALSPTARRDYIHKRELDETKSALRECADESNYQTTVARIASRELRRLEQLTEEPK